MCEKLGQTESCLGKIQARKRFGDAGIESQCRYYHPVCMTVHR